MLNKIILPALTAALVVMAMPSQVDAYGAAHVGYTHVGPAGVYHTGATVAAGPGGVVRAGGTTAVGVGGAAYRTGYGVAAGYGGAAAVGGYRYTPGYYGGAAAVGGVQYGYVR